MRICESFGNWSLSFYSVIVSTRQMLLSSNLLVVEMRRKNIMPLKEKRIFLQLQTV